jgi:hypothetical protein
MTFLPGLLSYRGLLRHGGAVPRRRRSDRFFGNGVADFSWLRFEEDPDFVILVDKVCSILAYSSPGMVSNVIETVYSSGLYCFS